MSLPAALSSTVADQSFKQMCESLCHDRSIRWCVLLSTFRGEQDLIKEAFSLMANTLPLREIDGLSAQTTLRAL